MAMSRKPTKDKSPLLLKIVRRIYPLLERYCFPLAIRFFTLVFFVPLNYRPTAKEKKAIRFAVKFTIKVAGKTIQCYRWGSSSKKVIVMHGWAGRATQFRRFIKPLLKAGYEVIGADGPAHGLSGGWRTSIVEFEEMLKVLWNTTGVPEAVIAHSFGGAAVLYAAKNGLPVKKLINIASPVIADEIINTYLRAVGGSDKTKAPFKQYVKKKYGMPFEKYTVEGFIRELKQPINLLLVHDENDTDVSLQHPLALKQMYPATLLYITRGLGHTRILKNDTVIQTIVRFIETGRLEQPAG
ncbi:MAG: alpha/beta hydrolase [Cyclobacteriaceae bacterium]|nr:MAG: alpha/beta hydrolase [Cyclobacteriaceae bacterium]